MKNINQCFFLLTTTVALLFDTFGSKKLETVAVLQIFLPQHPVTLVTISKNADAPAGKTKSFKLASRQPFVCITNCHGFMVSPLTASRVRHCGKQSVTEIPLLPAVLLVLVTVTL